MSPRSASPAARRSRAVESFRSAGEAIGPIVPGLSVFCISRGQWSMIDAILWVLDQVGPASVSVWTWTVADYEIQTLGRLRDDGRVRAGLLVIDHGARYKNKDIIAAWRGRFGPESVKYCLNHAKIAAVEGGGLRVLLRGSCNLNKNARFENLDVTEGGEDFALVKRIEAELPVLPDDCSGDEVYRASRVAEAFEPAQLDAFRKLRVWAK